MALSAFVRQITGEQNKKRIEYYTLLVVTLLLLYVIAEHSFVLMQLVEAKIKVDSIKIRN
jgi:hypothetical protein